jgi:hypothetical protein
MIFEDNCELKNDTGSWPSLRRFLARQDSKDHHLKTLASVWLSMALKQIEATQ